MSTIPSWAEFEAVARTRGCDEVMVRDWSPHEVVPTHSHPFAAEALVVAGEMWLTRNTDVEHLKPGGTFVLAPGEPHDERYGPDGATYWVARTTPVEPNTTKDN